MGTELRCRKRSATISSAPVSNTLALPTLNADCVHETSQLRQRALRRSNEPINAGLVERELSLYGTSSTIAQRHGGYAHPRRVAPISKQPRLLTQINNNRGLTTTVSYASMHSDSVVQHPELGKAVPTTQWVVASVAATDSLPSTKTSKTTYKYTSPRRGADPATKRYAFRGFERVDTISPSGAKTVEFFTYDPDWSGRLQKTLVMPAPTEQTVTDEVRSVDSTTWQALTLFGGALTTYHAVVSDHWTCKNGQNEAACVANIDTRTRTVRTFTPLGSTTASDTTPLLYEQTAATEQLAEAPTDGDRTTSTTFARKFDATNYRLRALVTTRSILNAGGTSTFARMEQVWDPDYRVVVDDIVALDEVNNATTHRVFDMDTGNVLSVYKPVQSTAPSSDNDYEYAYDARKLFVATETSPRTSATGTRQVRDYTWEYGTGTKLETLGPNVAPCAYSIPQQCSPGTPDRENHRVRVDGLGRMIERWETVASHASEYVNFKIETNAYVDGPAASVTHQSAIDYNEYIQTTRYRQEKTEIDGHGRAIKKTIYVFGDAPADEVMVYAYSQDGTLASVELPDPRANDASRVTYTYKFDSLGRPRSMRRPDASVGSQSGLDFSYDGLRTKRSEWVGVAGGNAASIETTTDALGRLVHVDERRSASEVSTTRYKYGADDQVSQTVDPEGVTSCLYRDFAGRRTAVARLTTANEACPSPADVTTGVGRWLYLHDRNGNVIAETAPCVGALECAASVSTTTYDELDRPTSRTVAHRNMTNDDLALFGDIEVYGYDVGFNSTGRLAQWEMFAPVNGASLPILLNQHHWTAQGQDNYANHTDFIAGVTLPSVYTFSRYGISGRLHDIFLNDGVTGSTTCTNNTNVYYSYDSRGLPYSVGINPCVYEAGEGDSYIINDRNVAGFVTRQYNADGSITGVPIQSVWTYDALGRVQRQVVDQRPTHDVVVAQQLEYFGNDDPKTLAQNLGSSNRKTFAFGYDYRHQLVSVDETSTSNYFHASYAYGVAGRFHQATVSGVPQPGGNVLPRDYVYQYDGADREQVTALGPANAPPALSYAYDAAGNQTMRCYGTITNGVCAGARINFLYDGKNQLRRATKRDVSRQVVGSEEYWYDETGTRTHIARRDADGSITEIVSFVDNGEWHHDATGAITRAYGMISFGTTAARVTRTSQSAPSTLEYQFHGLANNTIAAVDQATGTVNASFSYAPFGEIIEATNGGGTSAGIDAHLRRMNDKQVDLFDDLAYYGARYHDLVSMTWTQADPLYAANPDYAVGEGRRSMLYTMTQNNPLRLIDPDGLDTTISTTNTGPFNPSQPSTTDESSVGPWNQGGTDSWQNHKIRFWQSYCATTPGAAGCMPPHAKRFGKSHAPASQGMFSKYAGKAWSLLKRYGSDAHTAYKIAKVLCWAEFQEACAVIEPVENVLNDAKEFIDGLLGPGANIKRDNAQARRIADAVGLNRQQKDKFHEAMRDLKSSAGDVLSEEELRELAEEIKQTFRKGN